MTTRIGIAGVTGRMGKALVQATTARDDCALAGGLVRTGSRAAGKDLGTLAGLDPAGVTATTDTAAFFAAADVVIDFTLPDATAFLAREAVQHRTPLVIGTTGLSPSEMDEIRAAARAIPVLWSANMSVGVTLLAALVEQAARTLDAGFDIEILEMHHRHKVDAPSGTALLLGRAAAAGRGVSLDDRAIYAREGHTGPRAEGSIGFATLRGGDVVGEHSVILAGTGERITLSHAAGRREIFAEGAVRAAVWLKHQPPGLYAMKDCLGL